MEGLKELATALAVGGMLMAVVLIGFGIIRFLDRGWYRERRDRNDR